MKRLTKIIRLRISDEELQALKGKNISRYIREAIVEKMHKEGVLTVPF